MRTKPRLNLTAYLARLKLKLVTGDRYLYYWSWDENGKGTVKLSEM